MEHSYQNEGVEETPYIYEEEQKKRKESTAISPTTEPPRRRVQKQDSNCYDLPSSESDAEETTSSNPPVESENQKDETPQKGYTIFLPKSVVFFTTYFLVFVCGMAVGYCLCHFGGECKLY